MLHLYDTREEYLDIGENNFCVCEELQHNRVFGAEGTWEGEGKKRKYICPLGTWTHRRAIWSASDPHVGKAFKYYAQYPGVMQGSQEGKRAKLWGLRANFGADISMKIMTIIYIKFWRY